jgi:hypothetical protein
MQASSISIRAVAVSLLLLNFQPFKTHPPCHSWPLTGDQLMRQRDFDIQFVLASHSVNYSFFSFLFPLYIFQICHCVYKLRVCHTVALPFTLKSISREKKNYENSNISPWKIYNLPEILYKKPKSFKILQVYNESQVSTQVKISSFKNPHIKIDLLLHRGQNPLSYYTP